MARFIHRKTQLASTYDLVDDDGNVWPVQGEDGKWGEGLQIGTVLHRCTDENLLRYGKEQRETLARLNAQAEARVQAAIAAVEGGAIPANREERRAVEQKAERAARRSRKGGRNGAGEADEEPEAEEAAAAVN